MKTISCIIPAHNEEHGIGNVLACVTPLAGKQLHEVIVVDDGSTDNTKEIVRGYPRVTLIEHSENLGKSRSVKDGIARATGEYVLFLDADLRGLDAHAIEQMIAPIEAGTADMTISYRKNAWPLFPFKRIDYLSGERILTKAALEPALPDMEKLPSYGLEVFLNRIIIQNKMRIAVVQWPNVENVFSQNKRGWVKGVRSIINIWSNVLTVISPLEMFTQNRALSALIVDTP